MTTTETTATRTYYRTAKGSHRHADWACANVRRSIHLGDVTEIPADEVKDWAPCDVCCEGHEVTAHAATAAAKADALCLNWGVENSRRIESTCRNCGKRGKVNRSTGKLRPHKPASA